MTDCHKQSIFDCIFDRVIKSGKHRIYIQKQDKINQHKCHKDNMKDLSGSSLHCFRHIQVYIKDQTDQQHDQINDRCPFEILLKRFKKASYNVSFFVTYHFQCHIVHGRDRCTCGNDRNTTDHTDNIQNTQIRHLTHKTEKFIVHIKNTSHVYRSFFSSPDNTGL